MRRHETSIIILAASWTLLCTYAAVGCTDPNDCRLNGTCCPDGSLSCFVATGGAGGTGGSGGAPPECIPAGTTSPVGADCGVFVSASEGDDSGDGSKDQPFATLGKALASSNGKPVYACVAAAALDEPVAIDDGVTLFGGLDCTTWAYVAGSKTAWTAPAGAPVAVVKVGASLRAEDFAITARDAPALAADVYAPGMSSIALVAETASVLELERCDVEAGNGGDGAPGEPPEGTGMPGVAGGDGNGGCDNDMGEFGGNGGPMTCDGIDASGGQGGTGNANMSGGDGSDGNPAGDLGKGGVGQKAAACEPGGEGGPGLTGTPGDGAPADALGTLSAAGYTGARGADGTSGTAGQGAGGGGGAKLCTNGKAGPSGGGGGSAGCAGTGGKGGYSGGASIGIASLNAGVKLRDVKLTAKNGGKGGNGASGQPGGSGGVGGMPGTGDAQAKACGGGKGGDGGAGGKGGGGRGGPSISIAYKGEPPATDGNTLTTGAAGDGGQGEGPTGNGAAGVAAKVQAF